MTSSSDEDVNDAALFQEPEGYFQPEKPATYTEHTLLSGQTLRLRLVGHNPLWVRAPLPPLAVRKAYSALRAEKRC